MSETGIQFLSLFFYLLFAIRLRSVLDSKERDILLLEDNLKSLEKHVSRLKNQIVDHENKEDALKSKLRQLEMEKDKQVNKYYILFIFIFR